MVSPLLPSMDQQLADIRAASDNGIAVVHIDTCLSCYLQDHHNRDGEALLGVYVDGNSTLGYVRAELVREIAAATDDRIPESITAEMLDKAVDELFADRDLAFLFDSSLDVLDEEEAETMGGDEMCQAWFLLTWPVPEEPD